MEFLRDFFGDVKDIDVKKQAKQVKNRMPDMPEMSFQGHPFVVRDFLLGIAVGGILGYLASLLFAPQSGEETRAYISDKSREIGQKAKGTVEEAVDKTGRLVEEGRDRVESTLRKGQKEFDATKQQGRDVTNEAREQLSDTLDRAADEVDPNPRI